MKLADSQLDNLLQADSVQEIKSILVLRRLVPSLPQAEKLRDHIEGLQASSQQVRLGVIHTYTSELLDPWLRFAAALNGLSLDIHHAPYGVTIQEAQEASALVQFRPDSTLLLLRREDLHPALQSPVVCLADNDREAVGAAAREALTQLVDRFRGCVGGQLIVTLLPDMAGPALGLYDGMAANSESRWWSDFGGAVADELREQFSGVSFLDLEQLLARVGRDHFFDARLWYSSVFPFSPDGCLTLATAIGDLLASLYHKRAKVIAMDADNTLWGGVIGEDGLNGIALGPDHPGRAYLDFQKRVLGLQQRGFILALCSKNNPEDVEEVFRDHPHEVLKHEHFAAERVNWLPKPDNLKSLAQELNLGLDSFIFVDDSDHECAAVRHALPEVEVVKVPARATEIPFFLDTVARLEITSLTSEDLRKTAMYAQERQRKSQLEQLAAGGGSVDDYLHSLGMRMSIGIDDDSLLPRLAQLTQKTNQFNLTTRRYTEQDMARKLRCDKTAVYHFSLADQFGDSGVVGLAIVERQDNGTAHLDTFLMSCRVIGRRAEQAFLRSIVGHLRAGGVTELSAEYVPTRKNVLVESFQPNNAFTESADGRYTTCVNDSAHDLDDNFPITIEGLTEQ